MKKKVEKTAHFFVDESGDPTFYDRDGKLIVGNEGTSKILIFGFIKTEDPKSIRHALITLQNQITKDEYLQGIPSLEKSLIAFHAKDDCTEVKQAVYKTIVNLEFSAELIVARKIENIFKKIHYRKESEFYDDLVAKLFQNELPRSKLRGIASRKFLSHNIVTA